MDNQKKRIGNDINQIETKKVLSLGRPVKRKLPKLSTKLVEYMSQMVPNKYCCCSCCFTAIVVVNRRVATRFDPTTILQTPVKSLVGSKSRTCSRRRTHCQI